MSNTINNANEVQVFSNANFGQVRSMQTLVRFGQ